MNTNYKIDNTVIKSPTSFGVEKYRLTKSGRLACGDMTMEYLDHSKKRKFQFGYSVLSGIWVTTIESLIYDGPVFFTLEFPENGVQKTAMVYSGAIKKDRFRCDGVWYWKDVSFALIEQ